MNAPAVVHCWELRRHWENGALAVCFPNGAPVRVMSALSALDAGINAAQIHDMKQKSKAAQ